MACSTNTVQLHPGDRFGKLTVRELTAERRHGQRMWRCDCECGNSTVVTASNLSKKDGARSCGCNRRRRAHNRKGYGDIDGLFWSHILCAARSRDIEVKVTVEEAWGLFLQQKKRCALTGVELHFPASYKDRRATASLDRKDSSLPYELGNIQWVHKDINKMKNTFSEEVFVEWCRKVVANAS